MVATSTFEQTAQGLIQRVNWPNWRKSPFSAKQLAIYASIARKLIVCGGRYSGKDHVMVDRTLRLAYELWLQNRDDPPHEGCVVEVGVMAKVSGNFESVWLKFLRAIPKFAGQAGNGHDNFRVLDREQQIYLFGDGIRISFLSLHGDGSNRLGPGYDILYVTEAAFIEETMLRDVIIPLVMRPTYAGYLMLNSTPENNWFDHATEVALTKNDQGGKYSNYLGYEAHELTSFDNPKLDENQLEEILAERDANYQRFRRRYLGHRFVEIPMDPGSLRFGGMRAVFQPEWLEKCWVVEPQILKPPFRGFMDVAWSERGDSLAIVMMDANNYVADIEVHRQAQDNASIIRHLERIHRDWNAPILGYDAQGRASFLSPHIQGRGLRVRPIKTPNPEVKGQRVEYAARIIRDGKAKIPHPDRFPFASNRFQQNCGRLRRELIEYVAEFKETAKGGYWFYGKPSGSTRFSDDVSDGLIGALNLGARGATVDIAAYDTYGV